MAPHPHRNHSRRSWADSPSRGTSSPLGLLTTALLASIFCLPYLASGAPLTYNSRNSHYRWEEISSDGHNMGSRHISRHARQLPADPPATPSNFPGIPTETPLSETGSGTDSSSSGDPPREPIPAFTPWQNLAWCPGDDRTACQKTQTDVNGDGWAVFVDMFDTTAERIQVCVCECECECLSVCE